MGLSVRPSFRPSARPSVYTILSPQRLLQFSRDLMKLSSYCSDDVKVIIFYRDHARLIFTRVMALGKFSTVSLVSATPLAVFGGF